MPDNPVVLQSSEISQAPAGGQSSAPVSLSPDEVSGGDQQGPVNPYASNPATRLPAQTGDPFAAPAYLKSFAKPQPASPGDVAAGSANTNFRSIPVAAATKPPASSQEQLDQQASAARFGNRLAPVSTAPMSSGAARPDPMMTNAKSGLDLYLLGDEGSTHGTAEDASPGAPDTRSFLETQGDAIAADSAARVAIGNEIGSGPVMLAQGTRELFTPTPSEVRAARGGAPQTPAEAEESRRQMMGALTKQIAGGGQVAMTLEAPEVGSIFTEAVGGDLASKIAIAKIAGSITVGAGASAVAGHEATKYNVSPEAKNLIQTAAFFIPSLLGGALAIDEVHGRTPEGNEAYSATSPRGKFGVGAVQSPEGTEVRAGIKGVGSVGVGPRGVTVRGDGEPRLPGGEEETPGAPSAAPPAPVAPPSAPEVQANAQMTEVTRLAATAQGNQVQAEQLTGMRPPPPPKPKMPSPAGMDDGHLSQQTVETAGQVIQSLPPAARPSAVLESVKSLGAWIFGKKTILGPDDQVVNVDTPKSAQAAATKIINAEMEKQKTQAEDAAEEKQTNLETAQEERDEAITPTEKKESTGNAPAVQIPKGPQVDRARAAIQGAPQDATADHFDQIIRKTALVTTPVRKALVEEEVNRRANAQEDQAATAMNGQPAAPGQSRTELQAWADGVKNGEHPFVHVPAKSDFVPAGVDGLTKTKVNGAGMFSGTYYHAPEVSAADIRKAARDKTDPQGALDAIVANWKGEKPVELGPEEISTAAVKSVESGTLAAPEKLTNSERKGGRGESPEPAGGGEVSPAVEYAQGAHPDYDAMARERGEDGLTNMERAEKRAQTDKSRPAEGFLPHTQSEKDMIEASTGRPYDPVRDEGMFRRTYGTNGEVAPTAEKSTELPADLAKSKPRYGYRDKNFELDFEDPRDLAAYTLSQKTPNKAHDRFLDYYRDQFGTTAGLQPHGRRVQDAIKRLAKDADPADGPLKVLSQAGTTPEEEAARVKLTPEAATGLQQIVEAAKADDPAATLDTILRHPADGKIITQALVNDGIITDSDNDVNPATSLLTTRARTKVGDALLSSVFSPEVVEAAPPFIREKLLGSMGSIGSIAETSPEWNIKPALEKAISEYGNAFRGADTEEYGEVVDRLIQVLDGSPEDMRKAFSNYAVSASAPGENPNPVLDFNVAFGTELTPEQFAEGMNGTLAEPPVKDFGEVLAEQKAEQKKIVKGAKVTYRTNKGKERTGEVAWTDGKKVRISDGGSTVNKSIDDVKLASVVPVGNGLSVPEPSVPSDVDNSFFDMATRASRSFDNPGEIRFEDSSLRNRMYHETFIAGAAPADYYGLKRIVEAFDGKPADQLRMKEAQEAFEAAVAMYGSSLYSLSSGTRNADKVRKNYDQAVQLYESQPNLSIRTSTSIENQAYSTPLPLAFIVDKFAGMDPSKGLQSVYEPTAGNGMLLIGAAQGKVKGVNLIHANELNPARAAMLKESGWDVTQNDASTWSPAELVDAVVANPPFAKLAAPIKFDGYNIVKLDHLIAAKALGVMKDQGRAAIIIGAGDRTEPGEVTNAARPFFNYLYSHYNVVSDFELDGDLYARQGASFPVRVIAIDGRTRTAKVSPVAEDIQRLKTWEEVYAKASEHLGSNLEGRPQSDDELSSASELRADTAAVPRPPTGPAEQGNPGRPSEVAGRDSSNGRDLGTTQPGIISHSGRVPAPPVGSPDITTRSDGDVALSDRLAEGQSAPRVVRREPAESDGRSANAALTEASSALADESNQFQISYRPRSEKKDVSVMAPKALIGPMHGAMDSISKDVGDLDEFVANELGYPSLDEMHAAFMGIQTDAIAAAIHQLKRGKALIIADQTGVGKGRVAAAMIRWAELHGHLPIFVTEKPTLFSDMHGDLTDIGSGNTISPLLLNSDASITNRVTGEKIFRNPGSMRPVMDRIRETGQLPPGRNALFLSYSQINTDNRQQLVLHRLAPNAVFVLDESHNAGGASATGAFVSEVIGKSKGVVFLSATWAKRPDNLPVYAGMTDISTAIPDRDKVADAIAAGGAPLQAVVTSQLAQAGQFVRRERSFDGIEIRNVTDSDNKTKHEKISDKVTEVLRAIMQADSAYHNLDFERILGEAKKAGKSANSKQVQVSHMEFSSIVHNMVKQLLLALKADTSADMLIASIEKGERPIYALENTMGSFLGNYADGHNLSEGDSLKDLTYSKISDRALMRTRYYNETDEMGNKTRIEVPLDKLSPAVRELYDRAQALVDNLNVDLPVSPLDHIRDRIEKAGYKVAEITGRDLRIDYSGDTPKLGMVPDIERKDRVNTATQFNNGSIDALVINKAAAAGISLHASEKFLDQRPRHMIVGQPAGDVNVVMQMLGRINRTGQVQLPSYSLLSAALPAEMRPAIVLAKKMKSLNANVSSNTRSATSVKAVDMFNKYGDKIVAGYLIDNPEMARVLGLEADTDAKGEPSANEGIAMKATGHSALLTVKEQQQFMDAITEAYSNYIDFLDETGQNDLEPVTYDYDARETHKERMYQGTDPSSPFGQDAHYGEYSIKRQGKPLTPEEVNTKLAETYGPEMMQKPPHERDTLFARSLAAHFEELYKPYEQGLTAQNAMEKAAAMRTYGRSLLNEYRVGSAFSVEINGDVAHAVVTNIEGSKKTSGNPYAPSSLQFTLAINSPLRSIKVPGSQMGKITTANLGRNADIGHLFRDVFGDSRQKAKIITGNLLGAYGELKAGVKGRIISFTMNDGTTQLGIQMPTKFDVRNDISETYAMRSPEAAREFLSGNGRSLQSSGQEIGVFRNPDGGLNLRTKISKAISGKFFLDPRLRELVIGGDFVSSGGLMKATVKDGMEQDALEVIMGKIALYAPSTEIQAARKLDEKMQGGSSKPSGLRKMLGGEEGFATVGAIVPPSIQKIAEKVGNYLRKAVPATWGELSKATGVAVKTPKAIGYEIASVLYPAMLADADARDIMGRALGEPALELFKARLFLDGIDKMFEGMPEKDWIEFVDRIQNQKDQPTPDLQKAAEMLKSVMEGQRMAEQAAVNLGRKKSDQIQLQDRAGYFPNRYSTPPGGQPKTTDEQQMARIFAKRPFAGPKTFTKQQKYTLKDAVADGGVPLGNPVRMVLRRLQEGAKFVAAQHALWNGRQTGLIVYKSARGKMPANFVKMQDNIARVFRPVETAEGGTVFIQGGEWVIDKDFGRIFNNYLSQDLIRNSTVGNGFVQLKTSSTAFKMAMSAFHYGTMTFWGLVEGLHSGLDDFYNQGVRGLDPEHLASGAKKAATFLINPVAKVVGGDRIIKYLKSPDDFLATAAGEKLARDYPDLPELLRLVFAGGFRAGFNEDFPENSPMGIGKDFAAGRLVSGTMKTIPFAARAIAYPLFNYVIPRLKLMANVQMLSAKLEQYSQAIANGDTNPETIARNVVAANENSFGEFNYENIGWNNTIKTAMQLLFLAPGWKIGTVRTVAQAAKEVFTEGYADDFYEKVEAEGKTGDWAHKYAAKLPQMGLNSGRLLSSIIIATAIATILDKILHGKWIWEEIADDMKGNGLNILQASDLEALHARTGKYDSHGKPIRFNLPSDLRDYEHAALTPGSYAYNSLAPWLTGIINTMQNRDALGNYVYNPADDGFTAFKQGLFYNLQQSYQPITASSYLYRGRQDSTTKVERTLGVIGGAPKGYDDSRSVARANELRAVSDPRKPLTPEQQSDKDMLKEAPPTRHQAKYALRTRNLTELDKIVMSLSYTDAKDVYDHATADEKKMLLPILRKKQAAAVKKALGR